MGAGTDVYDGNGGKKKIVTVEDLTPKFTRDEQLAPLRGFLSKLLENKQDTNLDEETTNGMGSGDLRDVILASGNMLETLTISSAVIKPNMHFGGKHKE